MKRLALFSLIFAVILTPLIVTTSRANSSQIDLEDIEVFQSFTGIAFLDTESGKIYVYDSTLTHCVEIKQLSELGQPIELLEKPSKRHY